MNVRPQDLLSHEHTATHCNTLQRPAMHCNTLMSYITRTKLKLALRPSCAEYTAY